MVFQTLSVSAALLSSLVLNPAPWKKIEAYSEQRQPVYIGASPRQMSVEKIEIQVPRLRLSLKQNAFDNAVLLKQKLFSDGLINVNDRVEFEIWPIQDDEGLHRWAFARWKLLQGNWHWIESPKVGDAIVPQKLDPSIASDRSRLFDDYLFSKNLYDKPAAPECIWTNNEGTEVYSAWLEPDYFFKPIATQIHETQICRYIPPMARFNEKPISFVLKESDFGFEFTQDIEWIRDNLSVSAELNVLHAKSDLRAVRVSWPADLIEKYKADVKILSGETEAFFPISEKKEVFTRKNNADRDNQLEHVVDYLEERYKKLNIRTVRQTFSWRGMRQSNLIAVIEGSSVDHDKYPVLLADHIDTSFSKIIFAETGERVSVPGADDNMSATAALLRAAEVLKKMRPRFDIQLLHLTGEEFPSDCLGARHYVSDMLKRSKAIRGLILLDMIGHRVDPQDKIFQINASSSLESVKLARLAIDASKSQSDFITPVFRSRFDLKSYLYNTDGIIFSDAGYPVVLLNEHINKLENYRRTHYHQMTDLSDTIDWNYATAIVKVAIETAARLAEVRQ